jgi:DNA-binding transcriptional LysR family regulator
MEISDLIIFKQVVESGGITPAAQQLNRVPSNITARIQKLEEELGKALFVREKNRLRISVAGEQLLVYAEKILNLVHKAKHELQANEPQGQLKIGTMEAVAATRLVTPLMDFHRVWPNIQLNLNTAPSGKLIEQIISGELDMAFVADPLNDPRLNIIEVYQETLVLVSSLSHKSIKKPSDLSNEPTLLGFNHHCAYRNRLTGWLEQSGSVARMVEISSYHTLLSCVVAGMGVGIVPIVLLQQYPFKENIQMHPLPAKWRKSVTSIIWRHDSVKASMQEFVKIVMAN